MEDRKRLAEGGAKDRGQSLKNDDEDQALENEDRQAVLNQGTAEPSDYPNREVSTPPHPGDRK